jgi:hypothetical protein
MQRDVVTADETNYKALCDSYPEKAPHPLLTQPPRHSVRTENEIKNQSKISEGGYLYAALGNAMILQGNLKSFL